MTDTVRSDVTLEPGDIETADAERDNKIPGIPFAGVDKTKIAIGVGAAAALFATALSFASGSDKTIETPKPKADNPETVARYDPNSVIAPSLATAAIDPSAPIPLTAEEVPAIEPGTPIGQNQGVQSSSSAPSAPQKSDAQILREASRRSTLVAYGGERAQGNALDPSPAENSSLANEPSQGRREPNTLDGLRQGSKIARVEARSIGDRNFLIAAGTFIPCVLQTAMDSSQPGFVTCVIPKDIYSDNGRVVLMEKGTKILGEYQAGLNRGQYRLFVLWNRAVTPRGIAVDVSSPATDALGRSGVSGRVNNFFWKRFGAALLFSLVEDAAQVAGQAAGNSGDNTTQVPSEAAGIILQDSQQIKPVLTKAQGSDVGITVAQDLEFSGVYGLSLK